MQANRRLFVDIDTQFDFMHPEGSLYVPEAKTLLPQLKALLDYASAQQIPVLASVDAHHADDPEFAQFPPHCVVGTAGQQKVDATLIEKSLTLPNQTVELLPVLLAQVDAVILEKTVFDVFGNPNTESLLKTLGSQEAIVFGVATDYCVKAAALGLKARGLQVKVVQDAVKAVTPAGEQATFEAFAEAGIEWVTTAEIIGAN